LNATKQLNDSNRPFPTCANAESWLSLCAQVGMARMAGATQIDIEFTCACTNRHCIAASGRVLRFLHSADWETLSTALLIQAGSVPVERMPRLMETYVRRLGFSVRGRNLKKEEKMVLHKYAMIFARLSERKGVSAPSFTHDAAQFEFEDEYL
jgi:hypothetical protein